MPSFTFGINFCAFQSTPSTRRETDRSPCDRMACKGFQSTPSTRRETILICLRCTSVDISIHSLHTEGDMVDAAYQTYVITFQSTPSTRRETECF